MKILKIPFSNGGLGKTKGTELAPDKITSYLKKDSLNENNTLPLFNIEQIEINQDNIEETNKTIFQKVKKNLTNPKTILIGGDHSITYPSFKAFSELANPGLIIFDAHPDCMHNFTPPTHEDFVKTLIKNNILNPENIILVGLRSWHKDEYTFLKENNIRFFTMKQLHQDFHHITETIMENARKFSNIYLSIDIDVVDPAFAPATGYPEPGGLTSRQLIDMLQKIKNLKTIKMIDIVEVNPTKDKYNITSKLAAKIITEVN